MTVLVDRLMAGDVQRFHTRPTIKEENIATHTFRMLVLADELYKGATPPIISKYILYHDLAEFHTGDIPYPVKQQLPGVRELEDTANSALGITVPRLDPEQMAVVKSLDMLSFIYYMKLEHSMGNTLNLDRMEVARTAFLNYIKNTGEMLEKLARMYAELADGDLRRRGDPMM